MYISREIDQKISAWRHTQMIICKAAGFPLHLAEIKRYGWQKWNGKSNEQHIWLALFKRELQYARACPISLQHKLHIIVFALNHGAEKLASYLSPWKQRWIMYQIIPGVRHCIFKQTLILWINRAKPFPMDASCQAPKTWHIPCTVFSQALAGKLARAPAIILDDNWLPFSQLKFSKPGSTEIKHFGTSA